MCIYEVYLLDYLRYGHVAAPPCLNGIQLNNSQDFEPSKFQRGGRVLSYCTGIIYMQAMECFHRDGGARCFKTSTHILGMRAPKFLSVLADGNLRGAIMFVCLAGPVQ